MTKFNPEEIFRKDLEHFAPYTPSAVTIGDMERIIKLDANENPYGPSPRALAALADTRTWNRYATQDELRPAVADYVGVSPEHIVIGNGADEVIDLVERIFLEPGDCMIDCPPSFEMYGKYATVNGARVIEVPRRDPSRALGTGFSIDVDEIERVVELEHPKMVVIANPNNPDGSLTPPEQVERLLALPALIVLDEAYSEFSGASFAERVPQQANVVVLRTFSKWAGLAGLRIGYGVAPKMVTDQVLRTKSPYNVNSAAIVAARASLEDAEYLRGNVDRIIAERERLITALAGLDMLEPLPTCTNFILSRVVGRSARELRNELARRGILIRAYGSPRLQDFVRISVGMPEQDDALLGALKAI